MWCWAWVRYTITSVYQTMTDVKLNNFYHFCNSFCHLIHKDKGFFHRVHTFFSAIMPFSKVWYVNSFSWPEKTSSYHNLIISLGSINGQAKSIWPCMRFSWINPGWKKRNFYGILCYQMSHPLHLFRPTFTTLLFEIRSFFSQRGADAPIVVCVSHPNVSKIYTYIAIFFKKIPNK